MLDAIFIVALISFFLLAQVYLRGVGALRKGANGK